jgi:hypothetical protein
VEVRAKMIKARGEDATFDATMEGMSAIIRTDFPALLAAWEADRAKIENAWHELRNLLDRNMPQDSLASAIAYMIDHSNTGWQRVCGWEKLGKAKDALLDEKDTRIAKLEAVVEAAKDMLSVFEMQDNASEPGTDDFDVVSLVRTALSALEGGQHDPE